MIETAKNIAVFVGLFLSSISALTILIKPFRKWFMNKISNVNKDTGDSAYTLQTVDTVQNQENLDQFSATVVLPREEADQLRGNFIYAATDKCKNEIKNPIVDNENVIVVDTSNHDCNLYNAKQKSRKSLVLQQKH